MPKITKMSNWECLKYVTENPDAMCRPSSITPYNFTTKDRWQSSWLACHTWEVQEPVKEVTITREKLKAAFDKKFDGYEEYFNDICKELGL